ncbi:hypothetical protein AVEN_248649-1 [Araneus ventricosus]|uniref:Uncharacterized protein n=1 Tax=Araneus ventricosus TaxID=182803 RepID=A0A4Y2C1Q9_ARAVE|nr:hypothetical protein AVEN_248649-1 [Araneus ventricosus]
MSGIPDTRSEGYVCEHDNSTKELYWVFFFKKKRLKLTERRVSSPRGGKWDTVRLSLQPPAGCNGKVMAVVSGRLTHCLHPGDNALFHEDPEWEDFRSSGGESVEMVELFRQHGVG